MFKRPRQQNTPALRGRCLSTSASLPSWSRFTMPFRHRANYISSWVSDEALEPDTGNSYLFRFKALNRCSLYVSIYCCMFVCRPNVHCVCLQLLYQVYLSSLCICLCVSTDYVSGGEMFTHLYQQDHFPEEAVRIYIGEIILALEHLHKVGVAPSSSMTWSYIYWLCFCARGQKEDNASLQSHCTDLLPFCKVVIADVIASSCLLTVIYKTQSNVIILFELHLLLPYKCKTLSWGLATEKKWNGCITDKIWWLGHPGSYHV